SGGTYSMDASLGFQEGALNGFTINYIYGYAPGYLSLDNYVNTAVNPPLPYKQNVQLLPNGVGYSFTVTTVPSGLNVAVDGITYVSPQTFTWPANSVHTLGVATPQGSAGTQYVFNSWSDGGAVTHTITAPAANGSYIASFSTQYLLTTAANPSNGGSVTPASGTYYAPGTIVNLTATANASDTFSSWTGNVANPNSASTTVTMSAPQTVIANFTNNATTTTVASSLNPSTYGQSVTFTAAVTSTGGGTPTGNVTFTADGSNVLGTIPLSAGQAALSASTLGAGSHSIVASYAGDTNHQSSTSTALMQSVQTAKSTLGLASNSDPSVYNQAVTFTASVAPQFGGSATGTVTFYENAGALGTSPVSGNQATLTLNTLPVGTGHITAVYSGDSNVLGSTSAVLFQKVNKASTAVAVASSLNPAFVGQNVTYTATVTSQYLGAVTGVVDFKAGAVSLGAVTLVNGQASITTSFSASGTHSITARYVGDANNGGDTSPALKQVIDKYPSSTSVVSSLNPAVVGEEVTFTATVTAGATGTVTFRSGGTVLGVVSLSGDAASLSTSNLVAGTHTITAVYSGDGTYKGSTSPVLTQTVNKH
ncbi:MAG TPA: Ig-like domain repeat protein, partial [Terriglobales bacterium]|nr:Ig-like domain repeat protein [Terriglobales bacterium]